MQGKKKQLSAHKNNTHIYTLHIDITIKSSKRVKFNAGRKYSKHC